MKFFSELMEKPWLTQPGPAVELRAKGSFALPTSKVGLRLFLVVVTILFTLFIAAYAERMTFADWRSLPKPALLWLNTLLLVLASVGLQWARMGADRERIENVNTGMLAGGVFGFAFLGGQLLAWLQLDAAGYFATANPANAFFYLITALHGLHILGGLVYWGRTVGRLRRGADLEEARGSIDLCAAYWHYMLVVWIVLFTMLLVT